MSEELDIEALRREWKETDMKTIEMALATGKLRREIGWNFVLMTGTALFAGGALFQLVFATSTPWTTRLPGAIVVGAILVLFLRFCRRQWLAVGVADALLTGTAADLVRGRQALLEVELYAWASRSARFCELVVGPLGVLCTTLWWWAGNVSIWLPVGLAAVLASFSTYGRFRRMPRLRREIADLQALAATLE